MKMRRHQRQGMELCGFWHLMKTEEVQAPDSGLEEQGKRRISLSQTGMWCRTGGEESFPISIYNKEQMVRCEVLGNPVQYPDFAILKSERVVIERVALPLLSVENVEPLEPVFALGYPGTADSLNGNQYCYADIDGVNATSGTVTRMEKLAGCEDMERQYSDRRKFRTVILSGLVRRSFCSSRSATKGSTGMNKQTVWIWHIPWGIEFPLSPWTLGCAVLLFLGILETVLQETQGAEENQKAENVQKKAAETKTKRRRTCKRRQNGKRREIEEEKTAKIFRQRYFSYSLYFLFAPDSDDWGICFYKLQNTEQRDHKRRIPKNRGRRFQQLRQSDKHCLSGNINCNRGVCFCRDESGFCLYTEPCGRNRGQGF